MAEKLKMETTDMNELNIHFLKGLFPTAVTEVKDDEGTVKSVIDFNEFKRLLSNEYTDDYIERYQMTWPEKRRAILAANSKISKTLRPSIDKSKNFKATKNIYIEGDNLDSLKLLRETYLNAVDMIYIDPPYNAGTDLLYKNNYEMSEAEFKKANFDLNDDGYIMSLNNKSYGRYHTDWLNMMYSRLKVARDLLTQEGCIVIAIDDNELINVAKLCDEVFGEENRIGIVTVVHKPEGRNQERYFATSNEFALFYAKDKSVFDFEPVIFDLEMLESYDMEDEKGKYKLISYIAKNHGRDGYDKNLKVNNPKNFYPIYLSPDCSEITLEKKEGYLEALPITATQERTWRYIIPSFLEKLKNNEFVGKIENGKATIYEKYRIDKGQLIKTHWIDKRYNATVYGTKVLDDLMKCKTFDFPKSIYLMEDIIKLTTKKNATILDFFSGSATTAHAVMMVNAEDHGNRKYIMIQLPWSCDNNSEAYKAGYKTIPEIAEERIRRAGEKIKSDNPLLTQDLDVGFRVFKLDSSNMNDVYYNPKAMTQSLLEETVDNVKPDRTPLDLLFQVMLELGIELSAKIEEKEISGKKYYLVNDNDLIACFDDDLNNDVLTEIAKLQPLYAVFKDKSFASDSVGINNEQIFKTYAPGTKIKVL